MATAPFPFPSLPPATTYHHPFPIGFTIAYAPGPDFSPTPSYHGHCDQIHHHQFPPAPGLLRAQAATQSSHHASSPPLYYSFSTPCYSTAPTTFSSLCSQAPPSTTPTPAPPPPGAPSVSTTPETTRLRHLEQVLSSPLPSGRSSTTPWLLDAVPTAPNRERRPPQSHPVPTSPGKRGSGLHPATSASICRGCDLTKGPSQAISPPQRTVPHLPSPTPPPSSPTTTARTNSSDYHTPACGSPSVHPSSTSGSVRFTPPPPAGRPATSVLCRPDRIPSAPLFAESSSPTFPTKMQPDPAPLFDLHDPHDASSSFGDHETDAFQRHAAAAATSPATTTTTTASTFIFLACNNMVRSRIQQEAKDRMLRQASTSTPTPTEEAVCDNSAPTQTKEAARDKLAGEIVQIQNRFWQQQYSLQSTQGEVANLSKGVSQISISSGIQHIQDNTIHSQASGFAIDPDVKFSEMPNYDVYVEENDGCLSENEIPMSAGTPHRMQFQTLDGKPQSYGFQNLNRHSVLLADGTERSYYALPENYSIEQATSSTSPTIPKVEVSDTYQSLIPPLNDQISEKQTHHGPETQSILDMLAQVKAKLETISEKMKHKIMGDSCEMILDCAEQKATSEPLLTEEAINEFHEMPVYDVYEEDTNACLPGVVELSDNVGQHRQYDSEKPGATKFSSWESDNELLAGCVNNASDNAFNEEATGFSFPHGPVTHADRSSKHTNEQSVQAAPLPCVQEATVHCNDEKFEINSKKQDVLINKHGITYPCALNIDKEVPFPLQYQLPLSSAPSIWDPGIYLFSYNKVNIFSWTPHSAIIILQQEQFFFVEKGRHVQWDPATICPPTNLIQQGRNFEVVLHFCLSIFNDMHCCRSFQKCNSTSSQLLWNQDIKFYTIALWLISFNPP